MHEFVRVYLCLCLCRCVIACVSWMCIWVGLYVYDYMHRYKCVLVCSYRVNKSVYLLKKFSVFNHNCKL